jgi:hypothetical protein
VHLKHRLRAALPFWASALDLSAQGSRDRLGEPRRTYRLGEIVAHAGGAAVYTPKDFELNRIMADVVRIVERANGASNV